MRNKLHPINLLSTLLIAVCLFGCDRSAFKLPFRSASVDSVIATPESHEPRQSNSAESSGVWLDSYETAIAQSQQTGKPILADFTGSDWCHWCVKLKQDVFVTDSFQAWANENVILLELDYPKRSPQSADLKQQNQQLASRYGVNSYPTVLLIDGNGQVIGKLGYMKDPQQWIAAAESQLSGVAAE